MRVSLHEGLASQIALPFSAASTGPTHANMSLTVEKFTPIALPSALMLCDELGGGFDLLDQLVSAELASHRVRTRRSDAACSAAIRLIWARTSPRLAASVPAPFASRLRSLVLSLITAEPAASRSPTTPA